MIILKPILWAFLLLSIGMSGIHAYTMTLGLQEDLPLQGYLGFMIMLMLILIPIACTACLIAINEWEK